MIIDIMFEDGTMKTYQCSSTKAHGEYFVLYNAQEQSNISQERPAYTTLRINIQKIIYTGTRQEEDKK